MSCRERMPSKYDTEAPPLFLSTQKRMPCRNKNTRMGLKRMHWP